MTSVSFGDWTPKHFLANKISCNLILEDSEICKEIPSLNAAPLHTFRDGQLVRFRGMIQDMYDPEYYFQSYEVKDTRTGESNIRSGMYEDFARCLPHESIAFESSKNKHSERHTCVIISVPGLNDWAKGGNTRPCKKSHEMTSCEKGVKRLSNSREEEEQMECDEPVRKKEKPPVNGDSEKPKDSNPMPLSREHMLNFPIPIDDGKACIVKIYEDDTTYKLNQVLEIIGFISLDPVLSTICNSDESMEHAEFQTHNPPASLVPRLHAVKIIEPARTEIKNIPEIISKANCIKSDLQMILSQLLFGDTLAADYLICHLISNIYLRKDYLCLGSFPLNITHFPLEKYERFPNELYEVLALLVPKSHYLELTLDGLNDLSLIPKKDYECNRLTSGVLQLSNHTHLVIDETKLSIGQVSPHGKKNYEAIGQLVQYQKITYDFQFYTMEFDTDIPVLVLSEGKSLIPCITQVRLKVDRESEDMYPEVVQAVKQYLKDEDRLSDIRQYLEILRHSTFQVNEEITNIIQEDFVKMRQDDKSVNADDLHSMMVLARLMSLSHGMDTLTVDSWKRTVQMEAERRARLPRRNK